jgi:hypothetical protein
MIILCYREEPDIVLKRVIDKKHDFIFTSSSQYIY